MLMVVFKSIVEDLIKTNNVPDDATMVLICDGVRSKEASLKFILTTNDNSGWGIDCNDKDGYVQIVNGAEADNDVLEWADKVGEIISGPITVDKLKYVFSHPRPHGEYDTIDIWLSGKQSEMASKRKKDLTLFAAITAKTSIYYNEKKKEICVEVDEAGLL